MRIAPYYPALAASQAKLAEDWRRLYSLHEQGARQDPKRLAWMSAQAARLQAMADATTELARTDAGRTTCYV